MSPSRYSSHPAHPTEERHHLQLLQTLVVTAELTHLSLRSIAGLPGFQVRSYLLPQAQEHREAMLNSSYSQNGCMQPNCAKGICNVSIPPIAHLQHHQTCTAVALVLLQTSKLNTVFEGLPELWDLEVRHTPTLLRGQLLQALSPS